MNPIAKFALRAAMGLGLAYFIVRIYIKKSDPVPDPYHGRVSDRNGLSGRTVKKKPGMS